MTGLLTTYIHVPSGMGSAKKWTCKAIKYSNAEIEVLNRGRESDTLFSDKNRIPQREQPNGTTKWTKLLCHIYIIYIINLQNSPDGFDAM